MIASMDIRIASQTYRKTALTSAQRTTALVAAGVDMKKLLPTAHDFSLGARAMYHAASKSGLIVNGYTNPREDHCICWSGSNNTWELFVAKPKGLSAATAATYLITVSGHLNLALNVPIEIKQNSTSTVVTTSLPQGDFALPLVTKSTGATIRFEYEHKGANIPFVLTDIHVEAFTSS